MFFITVLALLLVISILPIPGNIETKIVLSGSMEPEIRTGSVVVIKKIDTYEIGDIVTFGEDTKENVPTTHRIIEARLQDGKPVYATKGDANEDVDTREVRAEDVIGKVFLDIPFFGYALAFAKKPMGFTLLIIIPALIIMFDEGKKIYLEIRRMKKKKEEEEKAIVQ